MGTSPPVVLIHGACSQPAHFDAWRAMFTDAGYRCLAPALPGQAPSSVRTLRRAGIAGYVSAIRDEVAALDAPPILVGHSMGALIARMLAAERPVAAVVLLAPLPGGRVPVTATALPHFAAAAPFVLAGRPFRPSRIAVRRLALHDLPGDEQNGIADGFVAESGRAYRDLVLGRARVRRRAVRCPLLVLHGDKDRLVPLHIGRGIAEKHGGALMVIEGHGHWLIAPSLVGVAGRAALGWIARQASARRGPRQLR